MGESTVQPLESSYIKNATRFLSDYFFYSERPWKARMLFLGCVLSIIAMVGLSFFIGWWVFPFIFSAVLAKNATLFLMGLGVGLLVSGAMAGLNHLINLFKNELYVSWRSWLTKKIINQYLHNKTNYLQISRLYPDIDNPDQRIQEDIDQVVEAFLDLSLGFMDNFSNLVIYTILLSLAGSSLSFVLFGTTIMIPGFLVLVALGVGIASSLVGYFINRSLHKLTSEETVVRSTFRADLQQIKTFPEEIAIEHAEKYYQSRLEQEVDELHAKTKNRLSIQNKTNSFNVFNSLFFQSIIPTGAAAPLYFMNLITIDVLYSTGFYFSMITRALTWFINSFETINKFQTSLGRIIKLQQTLNENHALDSAKKITRTIAPKNGSLVVNNLDLCLPQGREFVIKGINLQFTSGIHTLIQAPSGAGKSSFFKAIAGTWLSGEGEVLIPNSLETVYFLPQNPTLPNDTLRHVLAYPDAHCSYLDSELNAALEMVNMQGLIGKLDEKVGLNKSLGEKQRIAFARVFLRKPDWVFLDEATASLDEDTEMALYARLKQHLPNTTMISIAHRSTVRRHHDRILFFNANSEREAQVALEPVSLAV